MPLLQHSVFFTLKNRTPEAAEKLAAACREHLTNHPGAVLFSVGTLAKEYDRQVNDRDYDVALTIVFESHAAHDAYQTAERHERFIAENATDWAKARVFDADLVELTPPAPATG
jgi:hypothetical protein